MELIVTADDFGYSPSRDDVIIDCFNHGILTGTSLMVNGLSAASAVEKAKRVGLCVGLHFNISEGVALSKPSSIPSLVVVCDGIAQFRGKEGFIAAERDESICVDDVITELRAQIERFIALVGHVPPYVDGHQHVHVYPRFAEAIAIVLQEYGITKTRFPSEDMDEVGWMNDNPRKPFRQTVYRNTLQSIPLYNRHGVYGGYGIGSSIGGSSLSVQRIINCCLRYPRRAGYVTTIELMTHPGCPEREPEKWGCGVGCDGFSQHADRVHEHEVLTNEHIREYLEDKGIVLCSYPCSHIAPPLQSMCQSSHTSQPSPTSQTSQTSQPSHTSQPSQPKQSTQSIQFAPPAKRVILMLSLKEGTGNTITGNRIASHLLALGYSVQMVDTTDHFADANLAAIVHNVSYNYNHSAFFCLFCIHAVRSGAFALRSGLPYVMMMGGTDINVNANDPRKLDTVRSVLAHARRIIAFTEDMRARAVALLQEEPIPPITVISQSTDFPHTLSHEIRETLRLTPQHRLLLLPSGLRPIKDIHFVLSAFSHYHDTHPLAVLCVMGPPLDPAYTASFFSRLPADHLCGLAADFHYTREPVSEEEMYRGVYYLNPIPHSRFMDALLDVDVVLNTSVSEGLAAIVLEAWSAGKVIVARKNSGNCAVIKEGVTGLLFETPEECIAIVDRLLTDSEYRQRVETSSKEYITLQGLFTKERSLLETVMAF